LSVIFFASFVTDPKQECTATVPPFFTVVLIAMPPDSTTCEPVNTFVPLAEPNTSCSPPETCAPLSTPPEAMISVPPPMTQLAQAVGVTFQQLQI
jgi:hypothetical protein